MGDELKSAYELAMERLAGKGGGEEAAPRRLTAAQKKAIRDIRQEYRAKLAEREILFHSRRQEAAGDLEAVGREEADYRRDREHLESSRETRIRAVREGKKL
ncbi:MAG: hypothetical protein ACE5IK_03095 [Acidobacteriota bacterium]